jgi:hypothetical protein
MQKGDRRRNRHCVLKGSFITEKNIFIGPLSSPSSTSLSLLLLILIYLPTAVG